MKNNQRVLIGVVCFNEADKLSYFLPKFKLTNFNFPYQIVFIDDGSVDNSGKIIQKYFKDNRLKGMVIHNGRNKGVGYSIRRIIKFGIKNEFNICVIMAGNGKDDPLEIPQLLTPIIEDNYDYVQGSRFLKGGSFKNLPLLRKSLIQIFTFIMYLFTRFKCSDVTNGFRAYKLSIFKDGRINLDQDWLDRYELETYLHYKVITLWYKVKEVPVSKNYIPGIRKYSKIRPIIDWWKLARPVFLLKLGIKS